MFNTAQKNLREFYNTEGWGPRERKLARVELFGTTNFKSSLWSERDSIQVHVKLKSSASSTRLWSCYQELNSPDWRLIDAVGSSRYIVLNVRLVQIYRETLCSSRTDNYNQIEREHWECQRIWWLTAEPTCRNAVWNELRHRNLATPQTHKSWVQTECIRTTAKSLISRIPILLLAQFPPKMNLYNSNRVFERIRDELKFCYVLYYSLFLSFFFWERRK